MSGTSASAVLLDTCAVIWLSSRERMDVQALDAIFAAGRGDGVLVSAVSAWEIGLLSRPRKGHIAPVFRPDPASWWARFAADPAIKPVALTPEIAIDASMLPGTFHNDPADRMLIATARTLGLPLVTRDRSIIRYARAGHVNVVPC